MRILLDTNIFIPLEDSSVNINDKLAELNKITLGKHQFLVHPATTLDLNRDKNQERRERITPRLKKYLELESPPLFDEGEEEDLMGKPKKDNDHVDNLILLALKKNCVHWLITEDNGIHKKAKRIGEQERVFRVDEAINSLLNLDSTKLILYPNIEDVFCYSIDLENALFNSLRNAYAGFDKWFSDCSKDGRKAWVCRENNKIQALCIYKNEIDPIVTIDKKSLEGKVLKLCTFKVIKYGYKIGELFLKQAFSYANINKIKHVYVTVEPDKHGRLEELFNDFGFYQYGIDKKGRDVVLVKDFPQKLIQTNDTPLEYAIKYFPFVKINGNSVYIVPIQPLYHEILFPESNRQQGLLTEINSAGNTIKKAYLCAASTKSIKEGDILFFYRTKDEMAITSYGIVEQFFIEDDAEKIFQWTSKRTVYPRKEIDKMVIKGAVKIILFRLVGHISKPISFERLLSQKIVNGNIQSITKISDDKVHEIINEAKLNNCMLSD